LAVETERQEDSARGRVMVASEATLWLVHPDQRAVRVSPAGLVIGRVAETRDAVVIDDKRMSRSHARIERVRDTWLIRDLGSRNGAFVGGRFVPPQGTAPLENGTVVRLGDTLGVFALDCGDEDAPEHEAAFPGISLAARRVRVRIARLLLTNGPALVVGETGSGKERVARALAGDRHVVAVNCAELRPELARSELFGHARGAFSGAMTARTGLVAAAAGGVLYLDEIGDLPLDVQAHLLRFLEDGSYRALGSNDLVTSSARVIGATHVDLDEAARAGRFRVDLLARLRAANTPLALPPLRERREDIPMWASRFLHERLGVAAGMWSAGALECLLLFPWLRNLRDLRGALADVPARDPASAIEPEDLDHALRAHRLGLREAHTTMTHAVEPTPDAIREALGRANGAMRPAAHTLGIERTKLYRLCKRLGIDADDFKQRR
jgi:DNA-binding NtrC family response regulator